MPDCEWWPESFENSDTWETACGEAFCLTEAGPRENGLRFCPYCGRPLDEVLAPWQHDDEYTDWSEEDDDDDDD